MRILSIVTALFLGVSGAWAQEPPRQIVVTGEAAVPAAPDMAIVNVSVARAGRQAGQALDETSAAMAAIMATLAELGIEDRDVQTTQVGLFPQYERVNDGRAPRVTGYMATNGVQVRVRDLDALGALLDRVVGDGANQLGGIGFSLSDPGPVEDIARAEAVRDARARAEILAGAAGVTLGPLVMIREGGAGPVPGPMMADTMLEARSAVPVAAGEIDVRASVTLVFAIGD